MVPEGKNSSEETEEKTANEQLTVDAPAVSTSIVNNSEEGDDVTATTSASEKPSTDDETGEAVADNSGTRVVASTSLMDGDAPVPTGTSTPVKASPPSKKQMLPGAVSSHADFVSQQSAQIKQAKEKERQARLDLNSPQKEAASPSRVIEAGVVTPLADFRSEQAAQLKEQKAREREARESLNKPAREMTARSGSSISNYSETGAIAPYSDFAAQQSAQIKAQKAKEREARESLNKPARETTPRSSSFHSNSSDTGIIAPHSDFETQQSAQIKAQKAKEREARESLNQPARGAYNSSPLD